MTEMTFSHRSSGHVVSERLTTQNATMWPVQQQLSSTVRSTFGHPLEISFLFKVIKGDQSQVVVRWQELEMAKSCKEWCTEVKVILIILHQLFRDLTTQLLCSSILSVVKQNHMVLLLCVIHTMFNQMIGTIRFKETDTALTKNMWSFLLSCWRNLYCHHNLINKGLRCSFLSLFLYLMKSWLMHTQQK